MEIKLINEMFNIQKKSHRFIQFDQLIEILPVV